MSSELYEALKKDPSEALPLVQSLLQQGVEVNEKSSQEKWENPLSVAAKEQTPEVIELLVNHGAEVNARTSTWMSPLMIAAVNDKIDNCKVLLKFGAETNIRTISGQSMIELAILNQRTDVVKLLLDHGVDAHALNSQGCSLLNTAIMIDHADEIVFGGMRLERVIKAFSKAKLDIIKLLLEHGVDVNIRDVDDCTPLNTAARVGDIEACQDPTGCWR